MECPRILCNGMFVRGRIKIPFFSTKVDTRLRDFFYSGLEVLYSIRRYLFFVSRIYPAAFGSARSHFRQLPDPCRVHRRREECDKKRVCSMIYRSFSIACKVERDWLLYSSYPRRATRTSFYLALVYFVDRPLHVIVNLREINYTSLSRWVTCCVHYFSSWLAQESMRVDCWLLRCLKHVRAYVFFTMSRCMCLRHLRDTSFPRWEFAKGSRV